MKKNRISILFILLICVLFGLIIGSFDTVGQRDYFEKSKTQFEENINNPNYNNLPTIPTKDPTTKIAQKIDNKIYQSFQKILKKMFSSD